MQPRLIAVLSGAAVLLTGIVLLAGIAAADPPAPTTPYPTITFTKGACLKEANVTRQRQRTYDIALGAYQKEALAVAKGVGTPQVMRDLQQAADNAAIDLNKTKYAEAKCQNNANADKLNAADKACADLALALNQSIDELAITQDLEAIALDNYWAAKWLDDKGAGSPAAVAVALAAYQNAHDQTKLVKLTIDEQRTAATKPGCKNIDRPVPTATDTVTPTNTPTSTDTPVSTTTDTPTTTDTSSPAPTS